MPGHRFRGMIVAPSWRESDHAYRRVNVLHRLLHAAGALGRALEERGFESVWAPEHSHIPLSRRTPFAGGGELPKQYYDAMDPFVALTAAAAATKTLKVGTGVCLVEQRDPIQTAKLVASIDQVSGGRFLFGIGDGWNQDEMENHGTVFATRHKLVRERIEAMKAIWTQTEARVSRRVRQFRSDDDVAEAGPEAASADHRRRRVPLCRRAARSVTATAGFRRLAVRAGGRSARAVAEISGHVEGGRSRSRELPGVAVRPPRPTWTC